MAKIKRIVTSGLEGRTLSDRYDDHSFIYNEEGLVQYYAENNEMSAVLKPGTFYGSDNDSGDGQGLDTIKLIPHYDSGTDQYVIIDPTAPNHVHIRAGGQIDSSNAELILGGEKANVRVTDYNHQVQINSYDNTTEQSHSFSFGSDGSITSNGDMLIGVNVVPGHLTLSAYTGTTFTYSDTPETNGVFIKDNTIPENRVATIGDIQNSAPSPVSWTPVLSGTGFVQSSNPATGSYMQFGKLAVVNLTIPFSATTNFGTGQYQVNLPIAAAKHTDLWAGTLHNTSSSDYYSIKGHVDAESSTMTLWAIASTLKDEPFKYNYPIVLETIDLFHMSFIYETI